MNHPILVGCSQRTHRAKSLEEFIHPVEFMRDIVEKAAADADCPALAQKADALHVVNLISWKLRDFPGALAEALGCNPALREYSHVGGNTPQWYVNRAADNLMAGRSRIAILAGCEVMGSFTRAMKQGKDIGAWKEAIEIPMVGSDRPGTTPLENAHSMDRPIRVYPMIENALRARLGQTLDQQRAALGRFAEHFSSAAERNPLSWFPVRRSADEAVTESPDNRYIGWPYTKFLNAVMQVDQAAAVIMTTTDTARELGIAEDRWVYLHGGQDAHDEWFFSERADVSDSPAIRAMVPDALAQAGLTLGDIDFFDLYSCFPVMPRLTCDVLGIADDDPRPLTVTGGLPYFGGAGNNYVMHSIAETMNLIRADRGKFGLVTSNGWYCTKHGVGIYGGREPSGAWKRTSPEEFQKNLGLPSPEPVDPEPSGAFTVEAYTVYFDRGDDPSLGLLLGRTADGKRALAQTPPEDKDLMRAMMAEEWVGKTGRVTDRKKNVNIVTFG